MYAIGYLRLLVAKINEFLSKISKFPLFAKNGSISSSFAIIFFHHTQFYEFSEFE